MSRPARLLLVLLAGLLLLGAVGALLWSLPPIPADAQGVGFFGTAATGTRTNCTQITNPVVGQTVCFDQAANTWKVYTGASVSTSNWVSSFATQTGVNNVRDFGAKGDGTTDDTAAVQAAITGLAAKGGIAFFPPGLYRTTATLSLPVGVEIRGAGQAVDQNVLSSILYAGTTGGTAALEYNGVINAEAYVKGAVRDIHIGLNNNNTYAIHLKGVADFDIDRVMLEGRPGGTNRGIYCEDCLFVRVTRSDFWQLQYGIVSDELFNSNLIASNQFRDMEQYAILLRGNVGGFSGFQGVLIENNHFIKLAAGATFQGALHAIAPGQGLWFKHNTLEVMQSAAGAVILDRTDPIAGGGAGFIDNFVSQGNVLIACLGYVVSADYTRFSTLGPDSLFTPAGPANAMYLVTTNGTGNVIPPGSLPAGKPLVLDSLIGDTVVSDSGGTAFYTGIARTATDPATNLWGDSNHAGRVWWNTAASPVRFKYWDGSATRSLTNALESTGSVAISGGLQVGSVTDPGTGALRVASGVYLNATQTLWNGSSASGAPQCSNNCGTAPAVVGTNSAMRVAMGAGTPRSPFTVLFNGAWNTTPACLAQLDTGTTATVSVTNATSTGVTVNTLTGPAAGNVYSIHCLGVG